MSDKPVNYQVSIGVSLGIPRAQFNLTVDSFIRQLFKSKLRDHSFVSSLIIWVFFIQDLIKHTSDEPTFYVMCTFLSCDLYHHIQG